MRKPRDLYPVTKKKRKIQIKIRQIGGGAAERAWSKTCVCVALQETTVKLLLSEVTSLNSTLNKDIFALGNYYTRKMSNKPGKTRQTTISASKSSSTSQTTYEKQMAEEGTP